MVTITLPPELEKVVREQAARKGTTPEVYVLASLQGLYLPESPVGPVAEQEGETMADFFEGYSGTIDSREVIPGGAHLSKDTGRKFAQLMVEKR